MISCYIWANVPLWPFTSALTPPAAGIHHKCRDFSFLSKRSRVCASIINTRLRLQFPGRVPFLWGHWLCRCAAAYLPWWVAMGGDGERMKSLPDWQLRQNVYEINIDWCNAQNPAAVALESSSATHPHTSPSSFSFPSPTHRHTYTHIFPRAVETKVLTGLMGSNRL